MTSRPTHAIYIMPQSSGNMCASIFHFRAQFCPIGTVGDTRLQPSSIPDLKAVFTDFAFTDRLLFDWKGRVPVSSYP